ncbi:hypothetical protein QQF64_030449 [Cirrhinus molitorella]|uniref:Uncharacterized protein n=2 Tax=Cirrhinus molitorella TaxID=172907 RepID=A0ABR3N3Q0_9TELE|nr:hypothetical protein Q8A67_002172 [Cirrhinus molitorella]
MDGDAASPNILGESKAGYILSNVAEVVERILTFVPTKNLLRIASVCRLWRNCARRVLRTQQKLTWLSASGSSIYEEHVLLKTMAEDLEKIYLLPQTALLMVDGEKFNWSSYRHKKARKCEDEVESDPVERLRRLLPSTCDVVGVATSGIVVTPSGSPSSPPEEHEDGEAGFSLLFPAMDGVTIRPFHFCKKTLSDSALEEAGLINNPDLKVVLMFDYETWKAGSFLNKLLEPLSQNNVLIVGGQVERAFSNNTACCSPGSFGAVGLTFSGSKIQGASVLVDQDVSTPKAAEATIQRLKAANIPEKNTMGFMFACVGRGHNSYNNQRNVEANAFRKIFSNIPLLGFFGNGEIGCDRIVKENYTLSETDADGLQHSFTTVMSLVHFG